MLQSAQQADILADRVAQEYVRKPTEHDCVHVRLQDGRSEQLGTAAEALRRHIRGAVPRDGAEVRRDRGDEHLRQSERALGWQHLRQVSLRGRRRKSLPGPQQPVVQRQACLGRTLACY